MDSLSFSGAGVRRITSFPFPVPVSLDCRAPPSHVSASRCRSSVTGASVSAEPAPDPALSQSLARPFRPRRPAADERDDDIDTEEEGEGTEMPRLRNKRGNWVLKIMLIRSIWSVKKKSENEDLDEKGERENQEVGKDRIGCSCLGEEETESFGVEDGVVFERDSFSRFLRRVSLVETRLYAKMSYLGKLAYFINNIKPGNLLKCHGLHFVTSSLEKKVQALNKEKENDLQSRNAETEYNPSQVQETHETLEIKRQKKFGSRISASYRIAAAAASYVQSQTRSILPFKSTKMTAEKDFTQESNTGTTEEKSVIPSSELASFVATTNSVTAMVAAKEETKEAVAKDLNSTKSSPCEWFICDDETGGTRFFVIQGSDSLASWQANLLFEPIQFEGLDVLVHRGIYEAAKGIYRQLLPEVKAHLKSRGKYATLRFTGHSLGGSLALLVNLMLLIRGEAPLTSLLPVITFGSPSIMCGGDRLLRKLGLPKTHVQAITMHRDIVPRAFSCNYPDHVAELLKAVNGNFRNHPCLNKKKMLYAPMGELLILQPDEKISPGHHLLPSGSGLYLLRCPESNSNDSVSQLQAAQTAFLNSPHPLEILSDPSAYGSDGAICRDHDMNSYLRSIRNVIRQDLNCIRKAKREQRRKLWWPLVAPQEILHTGILMHPQLESGDVGQHHQLTISSFLRTGME